MKDLVQVLKAADAAARWHVDQRRKGAAREPYINHLLEVATLVCEATEGADVNLVTAALLHDAVEDQGITLQSIASDFGADVAALVNEVTDDQTIPKAERKRLQVEHAPQKSDRAAILKLADKTSNLRAIVRSPPADWSVECRLAYVRWARDVVAGLPAGHPWLTRQFQAAATEADATVTAMPDGKLA